MRLSLHSYYKDIHNIKKTTHKKNLSLNDLREESRSIKLHVKEFTKENNLKQMQYDLMRNDNRRFMKDMIMIRKGLGHELICNKKYNNEKEDKEKTGKDMFKFSPLLGTKDDIMHFYRSKLGKQKTGNLNDIKLMNDKNIKYMKMIKNKLIEKFDNIEMKYRNKEDNSNQRHNRHNKTKEKLNNKTYSEMIKDELEIQRLEKEQNDLIKYNHDIKQMIDKVNSENENDSKHYKMNRYLSESNIKSSPSKKSTSSNQNIHQNVGNTFTTMATNTKSFFPISKSNTNIKQKQAPLLPYMFKSLPKDIALQMLIKESSSSSQPISKNLNKCITTYFEKHHNVSQAKLLKKSLKNIKSSKHLLHQLQSLSLKLSQSKIPKIFEEGNYSKYEEQYNTITHLDNQLKEIQEIFIEKRSKLK